MKERDGRRFFLKNTAPNLARRRAAGTGRGGDREQRRADHHEPEPAAARRRTLQADQASTCSSSPRRPRCRRSCRRSRRRAVPHRRQSHGASAQRVPRLQAGARARSPKTTSSSTCRRSPTRARPARRRRPSDGGADERPPFVAARLRSSGWCRSPSSRSASSGRPTGDVRYARAPPAEAADRAEAGRRSSLLPEYQADGGVRSATATRSSARSSIRRAGPRPRRWPRPPSQDCSAASSRCPARWWSTARRRPSCAR